jgi:hypothetical protein
MQAPAPALRQIPPEEPTRIRSPGILFAGILLTTAGAGTALTPSAILLIPCPIDSSGDAATDQSERERCRARTGGFIALIALGVAAMAGGTGLIVYGAKPVAARDAAIMVDPSGVRFAF